ncbi:MAG: DUF4349 domain-containing protein [Bacteroidia bacterium]|jgi:hypothetical protein|nr:DUF4349 domain-containing protein [Bacteroidia bacterium]GIV23692.1 MAG: lipoprotein [Bacteroidia bacterium]
MRALQITGGLLAGIVFWGCGGGERSSPDTYTSSPEAKQSVSASLTLIPHRWEGASDSIETWTARSGGKILQREKYENRFYSYTLRIPTTKALDFFTQVRTLGEVLNEHTSLSDITRAYNDIEARLKAKEEAVERLRALLREAHTPSEILEAEKALQIALTERDSLRSSWENNRLLSETVQVDITLRNRRFVSYQEGGSYWAQFWQSIEAGWDGFVYFTFALAYLWWLWLLIGLGSFLYWWRQRKKTQPPTAA